MKGTIGVNVDVAAILALMSPHKPGQSPDRDFSNGGQHKFDQGWTHHYASGRGMFGGHWQCKNPNCKYYDQASLYDTIAKSAACCTKCSQCGDWNYNNRQTCPNAPKQEVPEFRTGHGNLSSYHGTNMRAFPDGRVDLTSNNDAWEKWTWIDLGGDRYLYLSCHGTYLRANPDGKVDLAQSPKEWQVWTHSKLNGRNVYRSCHGTYLRGYPYGRVDLSEKPNDWETWTG